MTLIRSYQRICLYCNTPVEHGDTCPSCGLHTFDFAYKLFEKPKEKTKHHKSFKHQSQIKLDSDYFYGYK